MGGVASLILDAAIYVALFLASSMAGLFLACLLNEYGLLRRAGPAVKALLRPVGLPDFVFPAVASAMVNAYRAEHMIIYDYYSRGLLSEDAVVFYVLASGYLRAVGALLHVGPIALAALGPIGLIYLALLYIKYVLNTVIGLVYGRVRGIRIVNAQVGPSLMSNHGSGNRLKPCFTRSLRVTLRVLPRFLIVIITVLLLEYFGVFTALGHYLIVNAGVLSYFLSPASITVLSTAIASPSASYFVAASLFRHGQLSLKFLLIALLLGSTINGLTIGLMRHSLPFYLSIYPPKLAVKTAVAQALADAVSLTVIITLLMVFNA